MSLNRQALYLMDSATSTALLRQRLLSRQWWAFITVGQCGLAFMEGIERRHYSGRTNADYEMVAFPFTPLGPIGIGLARKRRMSVRELARHLDRGGMPHEAETLSKYGNDVIVLAPSPEVAERTQNWLVGMMTGEAVGAR